MSKKFALMEDSASLSIVQEEDKNVLKLLNGTTEVSSVELPAGSGGGGFELANPSGAIAISGDEEVTIKWSDPLDLELEGVVLAKWSKTIVVRKAGSAPQNAADGVTVVEETTRNQYASTGYTDTGLTNGTTYYYGVFPIATSGATTVGTVVSGTPVAQYPSAVTGFAVTTKKGSATVTFTKPANAIRVDLVYKMGSAPTSSADGTKITNYVSGTEITGLTDDATYYFIAYTYNAKGRETASTVISEVIKSTVAVPTQNGTLTYTGSAQSPSWNNYDPDKLTLGGVTTSTDAGTYSATFTPKNNYVWADGTSGAKSVSWTIGRAGIASIPTQNGTLTYTGSAQSPTWSNFDSSKLTIGGTTSGTDAGSYTATFTPTKNYKWASDNGTTAKNATWSIGRANIASIPSQSGTLTYSGSAQSPSWSNYNSAQLTLGGTTSGTNAGSYNATFTPTANYKWGPGVNDSDTTGAVTKAWTIGKAAGSLTLSKTSAELNLSSSPSTTVTVTRAGNGTISATSSNAAIATVSGTTTLTITGKAKGTATITVSVAAGTNHNAPTSQTIAVTVKTLEIVDLPSATPEQIVEMIDGDYSGDINIEDYWSVGQAVQLDIAQMATPNTGVSGAAAWPAQKLTFVAVAFHHHDLATAINGKTKAAVTFQARECLNSTNNYDKNDSAYVNGDASYDTTFTKWSNLPLRTWLNDTFKNALPAAWKNAIKPIKHKMLTAYNTASYEDVTDSVFLPTYPEVFGTAAYTYYLGGATNSQEGTQWPYYATASNRIKYRNNNGNKGSAATIWWEGSPSSYYNSSYGYLWCRVDTGGTASLHNGSGAYGVAPAFCL